MVTAELGPKVRHQRRYTAIGPSSKEGIPNFSRYIEKRIDMDSLQDAFRRLQVSMRYPEEMYVDRPQNYSVSERIYDLLTLEASSRLEGEVAYGNHILIGARGTGKTTEMQHLARLLSEDPYGHYFPVFVPSSRFLNLVDFHFNDIPWSLTMALLDKLHELEIESIVPSESLDKLTTWATSNFGAEEKEIKELKFDSNKVVFLGKLIEYLGVQYTSTKQYIHFHEKKEKAIDSDIVPIFNSLISEIKERQGKTPIFLIDDAEKVPMEKWDTVFRTYGREFSRLAGASVWVLSPALSRLQSYRICRSEFDWNEVLIDPVPVLDLNGNRIGNNFDFYKQIFDYRIVGDILSEDVLFDILSICNCNIRSTISFAKSCIVSLRRDDAENVSISEDVINQVKSDHFDSITSHITVEELDRLAKIHVIGELIDDGDAKLIDSNLLSRFRHNSNTWYRVSPAVQEMSRFVSSVQKYETKYNT